MRERFGILLFLSFVCYSAFALADAEGIALQVDSWLRKSEVFVLFNGGSLFHPELNEVVLEARQQLPASSVPIAVERLETANGDNEKLHSMCLVGFLLREYRSTHEMRRRALDVVAAELKRTPLDEELVSTGFALDFISFIGESADLEVVRPYLRHTESNVRLHASYACEAITKRRDEPDTSLLDDPEPKKEAPLPSDSVSKESTKTSVDEEAVAKQLLESKNVADAGDRREVYRGSYLWVSLAIACIAIVCFFILRQRLVPQLKK